MPDLQDQQLFDEDEIGRILHRASEMQGKKGKRPEFGLSLAELQQLARDADIDPSFVAAAALELSSGDDPAKSTFLGGPLTLALKRRIPGEVSEEAFSRMVSAARRHFEISGQTSEVGSTREWSAGTERGGTASFSLRERNGNSEVEVFWSEGILPIPFIAVTLVLCIVSLPIIFESLAMGGLAGAMTWLATAFMLANISRFAFAKVASRRRRGVGNFADSLVAIAEAEAARELLSEQSAMQAPMAVEVQLSQDNATSTPRVQSPRVPLPDPGPADADSHGGSGRDRVR